MPNITNLASTTALSALENKIPNVNILVKKVTIRKELMKLKKKITTDHDHDKYITTQEFIYLAAENFTGRLAKVNLINENDIANFIK